MPAATLDRSRGAARVRLRAFQTALAERLRQPAAAGGADTLLAVRAGAEGWLLQLDEIATIQAMPGITPVPLTHAWFRGVASLRGVLTSVVDLAQFFGSPPQAIDQKCHLITLAAHLRCNVALLVSGLAGLRHGHALHPAAEAVDGVIRPAAHAGWRGRPLVDDQQQVWQPLSLRALVRLPQFLDAGLLGPSDAVTDLCAPDLSVAP